MSLVKFGNLTGTITHLLTQRENPLAVLSSGSPMLEQGSPTIGRILLLQRVTPEPVSNKARTLTPPREMSALGHDNLGRVALKQFRAVRQVRSCWGTSRLKAIPRGRFPTTMGCPGISRVLTHGSRSPLHRGRVHRYHIYLYRVLGRGMWGLAREGPKFWRNRPRLVPKGAL